MNISKQTMKRLAVILSAMLLLAATVLSVVFGLTSSYQDKHTPCCQLGVFMTILASNITTVACESIFNMGDGIPCKTSNFLI